MSFARLTLIFLLTGPFCIRAQVYDDFSDGDFTSSPAWQGDVDKFQVTGGALNTNGPSDAAGELYLSTPNTLLHRTTWKFSIAINGTSPSASNRVRIYLVSNQENLKGNLDGYFLQIGETGADHIDFLRSDGATSTLLFSGTGVFSGEVTVQVIRDDDNNWYLYADYEGGEDLQLEGVVVDDTYTSGAYFGVVVNHTSSRYDDYFFDDVHVDQLRIDSIGVLSPTELEVTFNQFLGKTEAETAAHYLIGGLTVNEAERKENDSSRVKLTLDPATPLSTGAFELILSALLTGHDPDTAVFSYTRLAVQEIVTRSPTELLIDFNDLPDKTTAEDPSNYLINTDEVVIYAALGNEDPSQVILQPHSPLSAGTHTLTITGLQNSSHTSTLNGVFDFDLVIPLLPDTVMVLNKNEILVSFNAPLNALLAENPTNYLINNELGTPGSALLSSSDSAVLLTFSSDLQALDYTLTVNNLESEAGTVIEANSLIAFSYLPLIISGVTQTGEETIEVHFNQGVPISTAETTSNYELLDLGHPMKAVRSAENDSLVTLTFRPVYNRSYTLRINGVTNLSGNSTAVDLMTDLDLTVPAFPGMIVINELMIDPTPAVGLPDAEYVEILNTGPSKLQLENYLLNGESLPPYPLDTGEHVLIVDDSDAADYSFITNLLVVPSFDALTNSSDTVVLRDNFGNLIDLVSYDATWYNESSKMEGGYSLELVNPHHPCSDPHNWKVSTDPDGGTPGRQNSVFNSESDKTGPEIQSLEVISGDTLLIYFSEPLEEGSVDANSFTLSQFEIAAVTRHSQDSYLLTLNQALNSEERYELSVGNVEDCFGNVHEGLPHSFYYDVTPPAPEALFVLSSNEIAVAFHESLDESKAEAEENYILSSGMGSPAKALRQDSALHRVHLTLDGHFEEGNNYTLTISHLEDTFGNIVSIQAIPFTFFDHVDTVYALAPNLLALKLKSNPTEASALTPTNYMIDDGSRPSEVAFDEEDPTLVLLAFENNFQDNKALWLYAEGLKEQSNGLPMSTPARQFIYDTRAPQITEVSATNERQVRVLFDEAISVPTSLSANLYQLETLDYPSEVSLMAADQVLLTFNEDFGVESPRTLSIRGVTDLYGNTFTASRKVEFTWDPKPPGVKSLFQLNDSSLVVVLTEKPESATATYPDNYLLSGLTPPDSVLPHGPDSVSSTLRFSHSVPSRVDQTIHVRRLRDQNGNVMEDTVVAINTRDPTVAYLEARSDRALLIGFSKRMGPEAYSTGSYSIANHSLSEVQLTSTGYLLILETPFRDGDTVIIHYHGLSDVDTNPLQQMESVFRFSTFFDSWTQLDAKTLELHFDTEFSSINKRQFNLNGISPILAVQDGKDRGTLRLVFGEELPANEPLVLGWEELTDRYHRRLPDYGVVVVRDTEPPGVSGITGQFFEELLLQFDEPISESSYSANHFYMTGIGNPSGLEKINESSLVLHYPGKLTPGQAYELLMDGISDLTGNFLVQDTLRFTYDIPHLPGARAILFNELMIDPTPVVGLPEAEYIELYNASQLPVNLSTLILNDRTSSTPLPDYVLDSGHYVVLVSSAYLPLFSGENVIGVERMVSLGNEGDSLTLTTVYGTIIDQVTYVSDWYRNTDKEDGGWSLEIVNSLTPCSGTPNWIASTSPDGGTPGAQNSVHDLSPDDIAPVIVSYGWNGKILSLTFSEPMDSLSLVTISNYLLEEFTIASVAASGDNESVLISFDQSEDPAFFSLRVLGLMDCSGNLMEETALLVGTGSPPSENELIITEIMYDPQPPVGLPDSEYLELHNPTSRPLSLEGVFLKDGSSQTPLPGVTILPDSFLILAPPGEVSLFGRTAIGVSGWTSLNNAGEVLTLAFGENLIFQVDYSPDWQEEGKMEGGYSLEMKDIHQPCAGRINWGSSVHPDGGTPGQTNSITENIPDNFGPNLVAITTLSSSSLRVTFDEQLSIGSISRASFVIDPALPSESVLPDPVVPGSLIVRLAQEIIPNEPHRITVSGLTDCSGNKLRNNTGTFVLPIAGDSLDILINEVLFNPRGQGVDFVEIYNRSENYIELKGWSLAREVDGSLEQVHSLALQEKVIAPGTYLALTPDEEQLLLDHPQAEKEKFNEMNGFPSYNNEDGTVVLLDNLGRVMDRFSYNEDMHFSLLESVDGVSLERVSSDAPTQDADNWKSASSTVGFATPGSINSQSLTVPKVHGVLEILPKVFVPGNAGSAYMSTFTTINYQFDQPGKFANVRIFDQAGRPVKTLANGELLPTSGFFQWDGTNDGGNIARLGYYVVVFEVYDSGGNIDLLKETVVVGR